MLQEIKMPDLGTATTEVTLAGWLKKEGDPVQRGEALCEVETDKATSELESVAEGILLKQIMAAGTVVQVGQVIAYIGSSGEALPAEGQGENRAEAAAAPPESLESSAADTPKISLMIRNFAQRAGVALSKVKGTGPQGQILREDVLRAKQEGGESRLPPSKPSSMVLSKNQLGVARTITRSWNEIVPINLWGTIRMTAALSLRQRHQEQTAEKLSFDAIFLYAAGQAMKEYPRFQAYYEEEKIIAGAGINVAVAVSVGEDLYIPVIPAADTKQIVQIHEELSALTEKARQGSLALEDMNGATFTISNLGMYPVDAFTAIIPPGQCGILTIGRITDGLELDGAGMSDRQVCQVILSVDHRFINGRQAAEFLTYFKTCMERL